MRDESDTAWERTAAPKKWFRRGDAQRFVRGSMEILVVARFDSIAVTPHATLVVGNCEPIRFRKKSAAMRAADQIEGIKRKAPTLTYEEAVRLWRQRRAAHRKTARERHRKTFGRNPPGRPPTSSHRPGPRARVEKPAASAMGRGRVSGRVNKATVHPSLWPENAGTW